MTILSALSLIAATLMVTQALLMLAERLCGWLFAIAVYRRMTPSERKAGHVSFAQTERWRREMLIGHLAWAFWCCSRWYEIVPRIVMILVRKGVRRE